MKKTKKALAASMALGVTLTMGATTTILAQEETTVTVAPEAYSYGNYVTSDKTNYEVGETIYVRCTNPFQIEGSHHWFIDGVSMYHYGSEFSTIAKKAGSTKIYCAVGELGLVEVGGVEITVNANQINYVATQGGSVSVSSETLTSMDQNPTGSIATPNEGYYFVNWTDANGEVVSTDPGFVPQSRFSNTYTANFAELKAASLTVNYVDGEEVVATKTYTSEAGISGQQATFDISLEIPEGYVSVTGIDTIHTTVAYGTSSVVEVEIEKEKSPEKPAEDKPQEPTTTAQTEQSKEETKKADGTNTSANLSIVGALGPMSVALVGMIALLKKRK